MVMLIWYETLKCKSSPNRKLKNKHKIIVLKHNKHKAQKEMWVRTRKMFCDLEAGNLKEKLASERGERGKEG